MKDIESIYREHAKTVYKFLYTKTQSADLAEELTQETFYRAVYSIDTYNGSCKITTWLCGIAKHIWLQDLEKKSKYSIEDFSEDFPSSEISIESKQILVDQKTQIMKILHGIKEPAREVLYLRLLGDLTFKEIGDILGQSETWARVVFFRGKKELLKGDFYEK